MYKHPEQNWQQIIAQPIPWQVRSDKQNKTLTRVYVGPVVSEPGALVSLWESRSHLRRVHTQEVYPHENGVSVRRIHNTIPLQALATGEDIREQLRDNFATVRLETHADAIPLVTHLSVPDFTAPSLATEPVSVQLAARFRDEVILENPLAAGRLETAHINAFYAPDGQLRSVTFTPILEVLPTEHKDWLGMNEVFRKIHKLRAKSTTILPFLRKNLAEEVFLTQARIKNMESRKSGGILSVERSLPELFAKMQESAQEMIIAVASLLAERGEIDKEFTSQVFNPDRSIQRIIYMQFLTQGGFQEALEKALLEDMFFHQPVKTSYSEHPLPLSETKERVRQTRAEEVRKLLRGVGRSGNDMSQILSSARESLFTMLSYDTRKSLKKITFIALGTDEFCVVEETGDTVYYPHATYANRTVSGEELFRQLVSEGEYLIRGEDANGIDYYVQRETAGLYFRWEDTEFDCAAMIPDRIPVDEVTSFVTDSTYLVNSFQNSSLYYNLPSMRIKRKKKIA